MKTRAPCIARPSPPGDVRRKIEAGVSGVLVGGEGVLLIIFQLIAALSE